MRVKHKKAKRVFGVFLAVLLIFGIITPAMANQNHPFTDVRHDAWFAEAVQFVFERSVMQGSGPATFDPQGHLTRAEVTALLFRIHHGRHANGTDETASNFHDVGNEWFGPYVVWANRNGIVHGISARTFQPNGKITRQEFATMLYRYAMRMTPLTDAGLQGLQWSQFTDRGNIAEWAYDVMRWMNYRGIVTGVSASTVNPLGTASRAEAAMMIMRFVHVVNLRCIDELTRNGASWHQLQNAGFTRASIQTAFEQELIRLVNDVRAEHGLPAFIVNDSLGYVARLRAEESLYHQSSTHYSERTGLRSTAHFRFISGIRVDWAGENLGGGQHTAQHVLNRWMESAEHRAPILSGHSSSSFTNITHFGVGFDFASGSAYPTRWSLWFSTYIAS